jgi:hypothetical protein
MEKKKRWPRNESLYNQVQENEFLNFFEFIRWLSFKVCKNKKHRDVLTCLLIWHKFPNLSVRRARSFLLMLKQFKIICNEIPCFKTLINYRGDSSLQEVLDELIIESSKPLAKIENKVLFESYIKELSKELDIETKTIESIIKNEELENEATEILKELRNE